MRFWIPVCAALLVIPVAAQTQNVPYPEPPASEKPEKPKRILTPEEKAEKEARHGCKVQICSIFATQDPNGPDVSCPIIKTWREEDIEDILGGQFEWPWGKARCSTQLKLKRSVLAAAASDDGIVTTLDRHKINCSLDLGSPGEKYDVSVSIAPKVTFKGGRATTAQINWDDIKAPLLAYSVIWPGAKLDNSVNILEGQIVKMINEFMGPKCKELDDRLPRRAGLPTAN